MQPIFIKEIEIVGLWGRKHFLWQNIQPDVNILVGINGSGKSTLIHLLWGVLTANYKHLKKYDFSEVKLTYSDDSQITYDNSGKNAQKLLHTIPVDLVSTFDVVHSKIQKTESPLYTDLLNIIYTTGNGKFSFFDYRLKAVNFPDEAPVIHANIKGLFDLVNKQFGRTGKSIRIDIHTNKIVFDRDGGTIPLEKLSSGEKQFLLIMFKIFLMERKPFILLMDEPEISLHIDWQFELINVIRELNPNCQLIMSTHSPSIFGDGWGDRITFADDITG